MSSQENSYSVLVIAEDPGVLIFIGRLLNRDGMRALFARSLSQAIEIAARKYVPIDLILSNVTLPGLSGPEAVNRIRAVRPGLHALYMAARTDRGVIRIDLMQRRDVDRYEDRGRTFFEAVREAMGCQAVPVPRFHFSHPEANRAQVF